MTLKQKAISGVKWTTISSMTVMIVQILQISILARYLTSSDFGLMAMVMVVIGFSKIFSDMGISNAIIYKQNSTDRQLSSLYWLNIFSGIVLFLIVSSISPLVAKFYNEPKLTELLIVLSLTFIIIAIGNQYRILFQKELQFNLMAKIEIAASISALIVATVSAVTGLGVYALVYATLTSASVSSTFYLFKGLRVHKPSFVYKHDEIKEYIGFGMYQMGGNAFNYFNTQLDVILIGKLLGADELGVYSIVKQLIMRPARVINPIINKVTFPVMAKVQDDLEQLKNIYLKTVNYVASVNFPIFISFIILAEPIVIIMFGEKWRAGIPIMQILAIYAMIRAYGNPAGALLTAVGRVDLNLWINAFVFVLLPIVVFIGSKFGLIGVASSLALFQFSLTIPGWYLFVKKTCGAGFVEYFKQIIIPFMLTLISGSVAYIGLLLSEIYILQILAVSVIGLTVYVLLSIYLNRNVISMLKAFK